MSRGSTLWSSTHGGCFVGQGARQPLVALVLFVRKRLRDKKKRKAILIQDLNLI